MKKHIPMHPGKFIFDNYMEPYCLSSTDVAKMLKISLYSFKRLIDAKSDVTPDLALKLSAVLGRSAESWLHMQIDFSLWQARKKFNLSDYQAIFSY